MTRSTLLRRVLSSVLAGMALSVALAATARAQAPDEAPLWLRHVAISPDGKTIAFTYGGQLYAVAAEGGEARRLTTTDAFVTRPVWSPDGHSIAFASDFYGNLDVFVMPASGGPATRLTTHSAHEAPTGFSADGSMVLFETGRLGDAAATCTLPSPDQHLQLYAVPVTGGRELMVFPFVAHAAVESPDGRFILYEDQPGVEQPWRKHDMSSQTRDVWLYDGATGKFTKLTMFEGEDRNPAWAPGGQTFFYLSERSGSFNVWQQPLDPGAAPRQVTHHQYHPVRSLSASNAGDLVYSYDGEIWRLPAGADAPAKVPIVLATDAIDRGARSVTFAFGATEFAVSPTGLEIAFVVRGDVFVMSADGSVTRQVTATPGEERSVSFVPDGRVLVYASERNGSWGLYASGLAASDELAFFNATLIEETTVLDTPSDEYQPLLDPSGARIAYLEDRETLRVLDLESGKVVTVMGDQYNYSYSDGDIWYAWSPDGNWIAASYSPDPNNPDVAIIDANGREPPVNISHNGYLDMQGTWSDDGRYLLWLSDSLGLRRSDSDPDQVDVLVASLTRAAADRLELSELDFELLAIKEKLAQEQAQQQANATGAAEGSGGGNAEPPPPPLPIEYEGIDRRISRVTPFSSAIGFYALSPDGEDVIYITSGPAEGGFQTAAGYVLRQRTGEMAQLFAGLQVEWIDAELGPDGRTLYMLAPEGFYAVSLEDGSVSDLQYEARMELDPWAERAAMFEHVWRLTSQKFYRKDMNGVDWRFYGESYARFLPHINNGYDFAELLSEMAGELNNSHTGSGFEDFRTDGDETGALGLFYAGDYDGPGIMVSGVLPNGPADNAESRIGPRTVIVMVDGHAIGENDNLHPLLNHTVGHEVRLGLLDPASGETWEEVLKPISLEDEMELAYWHWVDQRRAMVAELSGGRIGYVHIREMDNASYREAYINIFGRYMDADALIVDVRFNPGGNLTNQLLSLLGGELFQIWDPGDEGTLSPDPFNRWFKPTAVLINPASYSDGYIFPKGYDTLGMGTLVGESVPGTGTAVWWETQQDPSYYYGIPQAGFRSLDGEWLEHQQLSPDVVMVMTPETVIAGSDSHLEAAVGVLMEQLSEMEKAAEESGDGG